MISSTANTRNICHSSSEDTTKNTDNDEPRISKLLQSGDIPFPRAGHSLVHSESGFGFLFGGASTENGFCGDLFKFHLANEKELVWNKIVIFNGLKMPSMRYEHFSALIGDEVLVMFGSGSEGPLNDAWIYNSPDNQWRELLVKGCIPSARVNKFLCFDCNTNRIYAYGGSIANNIPVDDSSIYCLEINDSLMWIKLSSNGPSPRLGHSMVLYENQLVIFGGLTTKLCNEIHLFNLKTRKWTFAPIVGDMPLPRYGHDAIVVGDKMIISGGMDFESKQMYDDCWILDLILWKWQKLNILVKRIDHSSCLVGNQVLMFGGMDFQNVFNDAYLINT